MIFEALGFIVSLGRTSDIEKNGDDGIRINLDVRDTTTGARFQLNNLEIPMSEDGYMELRQLMKEGKPLSIKIWGPNDKKENTISK